METITRNKATAADIKRLEDATTNPFTGTARPKGHEQLLEGRRKLPVYERTGEILATYHENPTMVLTSGTGSGKSTQIPQMTLYDEYASGLKVACTQPRRLAATSLAGRVAKEMGVALGEQVGYQIGGDKKVGKETRLVYMTDGVLLGKQAYDSDLAEFACVIIDEAHERSVQTDLLLALLKKIQSRRKDLKVRVSSRVNYDLTQLTPRAVGHHYVGDHGCEVVPGLLQQVPAGPYRRRKSFPCIRAPRPTNTSCIAQLQGRGPPYGAREGSL